MDVRQRLPQDNPCLRPAQPILSNDPRRSRGVQSGLWTVAVGQARSREGLLVDDSPTAWCMLRELLAGAARVVLVGVLRSAEDALTQMAELRPDLAIMDLALPGLSGVEATAELRRSHPRVRVIGFTSSDAPELLDAFIRARAEAVFPKERGLALRDYLRAAAVDE
jgi:DNA-binding NarL/FixJ family response regulator